MTWWIVEKRNHLALHGIFDARERAEHHLKEVIPPYVRLGYFMDKSLQATDFEIIEVFHGSEAVLMGIDTNGEWNGTCACGKTAMDGVRCYLGATHAARATAFAAPWTANPAPSLPWMLTPEPSQSSGPTATVPTFAFPWFIPRIPS